MCRNILCWIIVSNLRCLTFYVIFFSLVQKSVLSLHDLYHSSSLLTANKSKKRLEYICISYLAACWLASLLLQNQEKNPQKEAGLFYESSSNGWTYYDNRSFSNFMNYDYRNIFQEHILENHIYDLIKQNSTKKVEQ